LFLMIVQRWGIEEVEVNAKGAKSGFHLVNVVIIRVFRGNNHFFITFAS